MNHHRDWLPWFIVAFSAWGCLADRGKNTITTPGYHAKDLSAVVKENHRVDELESNKKKPSDLIEESEDRPVNEQPGVVGSGDEVTLEPASEEDIFRELPGGEAQLSQICSREGTDRVRDVFCTKPRPALTGLRDLQAKLGIAIVDAQGGSAEGGNPGFAITGHSSSLVARQVSAINPRVILFDPNPTNFVALGFVRGEQLVELIAKDSISGELKFFLLRFRQSCNSTETCTVGDLLTPAVETGWTGYDLYEDLDLQNTIFDCLQCHQPDGPGTPKALRMQELQNPWTHFFRDNRGGGRELIRDFQAAHGTEEEYGGIPGSLIAESDPGDLEDFMRDAGFGDQPNEFPTGDIESEVEDSSAAQPADNSVPGVSASWNTIYELSVRGEAIAVPYHDVKVSDPARLREFTAAYQNFRNGTIPAAKLPDIRDIFPPSLEYKMGFGVKPGLDAQGILDHGCKQCHNDKLNQAITRANFNTDLSKVAADVIEAAIERLNRPAADPKRMPPARFKDLKANEKALLIEYLQTVIGKN